MLSGDNGILQRATDAKTQTGVGQEKEALSLAWNSCMVNKVAKYEDITDIQLSNELKNNGYNDVSVEKSGNKFKVTFSSGNIYTIKNDGTVQKYEIVEPTAVYAKLYTTDGILTLSSTDDYIDTTLGEYTDYGDVSHKVDYYTESRMGPEKLYGVYPGWIDENIYMPANSKIKRIIIHDKIAPIKTAYWFAGCNQITSIEGIENLDTSNVTDMTCMFRYCNNLQSIDLNNFDTENVTNMYSMFDGCSKLTSLNLSSFNTKNVTNAEQMFGQMIGLTSLDLSSFDTSKLTSARRMFWNCYNLKNLNLNGWSTSNITDMAEMFYCCYTLNSITLNNFNTENVTNMYSLFYGCESINILDLSHFNTMKVENSSNMFGGWQDGVGGVTLEGHGHVLPVKASIIIGSNWNPSMTETATNYYNGTFEVINN